MKILYLVRGLPGAGKSSLAKLLASRVVEADHFHIKNGKYEFDPNNLHRAHMWCELTVEKYMRENTGSIAVANTFTTNSEITPYITLAKSYGYNYQIIAIENRPFISIHNVPDDVIQKMKERWECLA